MKKMTTLIAIVGFALTLSSCAKDELVTPNPAPQTIDTLITDTTVNNPADSLIIYKVYGSNPDISFNISGYNTPIGIDAPYGAFQGVWADTINYVPGSQLDYGLSLTFMIHLFVETPGCPPPAPNFGGRVIGEIWYKGELVASGSATSAAPTAQVDLFYQIPE